MFSLIYELILWLGFIACMPKALYQCIRYKKYRTSWLARFGWGFPNVERKGSGPVIWLHAVSVGEIAAIKSLSNKLQTAIQDLTLIVSTVTETGYAEAKRLMPFADHIVFLPYDFSWPVKLAIQRASPDIVIVCEADFWYRFLKEAKKQGAVVLLVNGKISATSYSRFLRFSYFTRRLFSLIDFFCVQSAEYKERFGSLGVPNSKIAITGNMKSDFVTSRLEKEALITMRQKLHLEPQDFVLVIGSTHAPEEELLLREITPLLSEFKNLKVIIAARHPERFSEVTSLVEKCGLSYGTWTKGACSHNPRVFLIDTMGILRHCYQLADVAIVAGSFTEKVGGHNILEAQCFGIPVITGPYMHSQAELVKQAKEYNAIKQVPLEEVAYALKNLLQNAEERHTLQKNSLALTAAIQGATEKNLKILQFLTPQYFHSLQQKA